MCYSRMSGGLWKWEEFSDLPDVLCFHFLVVVWRVFFHLV